MRVRVRVCEGLSVLCNVCACVPVCAFIGQVTNGTEYKTDRTVIELYHGYVP